MLTAESLRKRINWPAVDEEANSDDGLVYLFIRPTDPDLEPIYFCMDQDRSFIQQFGFGQRHYHPDGIEQALETAMALVRRERCVVEQRNAAGKYLGSGPCEPSALPDTLHRQTAFLRRVFFDRQATDESIDFTKYFRGRHIWISHKHKEEIERMYRQAGKERPEW